MSRATNRKQLLRSVHTRAMNVANHFCWNTIWRRMPVSIQVNVRMYASTVANPLPTSTASTLTCCCTPPIVPTSAPNARRASHWSTICWHIQGSTVASVRSSVRNAVDRSRWSAIWSHTVNSMPANVPTCAKIAARVSPKRIIWWCIHASTAL